MQSGSFVGITNLNLKLEGILCLSLLWLLRNSGDDHNRFIPFKRKRGAHHTYCASCVVAREQAYYLACVNFFVL